MNLFEKATRKKLRFHTDKGILSIEDIWDLPLIHGRNGTSLDTLYKELNKERQKQDGESIIVPTLQVNTKTKLKFDLVKYIIQVKLKEREEKEKFIENQEKKEKIMSIIAAKQDESLINTDIDDLKKMLKDL